MKKSFINLGNFLKYYDFFPHGTNRLVGHNINYLKCVDLDYIFIDYMHQY